jgi:hypothetical protein
MFLNRLAAVLRIQRAALVEVLDVAASSRR